MKMSEEKKKIGAPSVNHKFTSPEVDDIQKQVVTTADLAKVFGLSVPRISQLINSGVLRRNSENYFPLCKSVFSYVGALKNKPGGDENKSSYEKARTRKMEAEADIKEMDSKKRKGDLVEIDDVINIVKKEYTSIRQRLFAIPNKIALEILGCPTPKESQALLEAAINEALRELQLDETKEVEPSEQV